MVDSFCESVIIGFRIIQFKTLIFDQTLIFIITQDIHRTLSMPIFFNILVKEIVQVLCIDTFVHIHYNNV